MDKRYQVFISSTFTDLREERKAIIETLLNAKYIPAGMEMFSASNDEQFGYIKKIIDNCDYYVLVIGARYGTINPTTGVSFTEQEYDYAISKNIPVLAFINDDPFNLPYEKRDDDKKELLEAFINKVSKNRLCKMWSNTNNLVTSVIISLSEEISKNPQLGWTRGSSYNGTEPLVQIQIDESSELISQEENETIQISNFYELVGGQASLEQCLFNKNSSDYPVGIATIEGYYVQIEKTTIEETGIVDCFTITGGSSELIRAYINIIEKGNTINSKNIHNQLIINLDFSSLSKYEIDKIKSSSLDNKIELIVFNKTPRGRGVSIKYSTVEILKVK